MNKVIVVLLLTAATLGAYGNTLRNEFVWDDGYFITGWPEIHPPVQWGKLIAGQVPMAYGQVYRPLRSVWYVMVVNLFGTNPWPYHFQALLIHLLISLLVYFIMAAIIKSRLWAILAALLFAVMPIHVEAVSFITASFDTMGILLMFAAVAAHIRFRSTKNVANQRWSWVLLAAAFFTYELTLVGAGIIWLYDRLIVRQPFDFKPMVKMIITYIVIRAMVITGQSAPLPRVFGSFWSTILFMPVLTFHYLRLITVPGKQSINHEVYPGVYNLLYADNPNKVPALALNLLAPQYLIPTGILLVIIALGWWWGRRDKRVWFAGLVALGGLVPVLQLVPTYSIFAERYAYISSFGVVLLIVLGLSRLKGWGVGLAAVAIIVSLGLTRDRNRVWASTLTLWQDAVEVGPVSTYAYRNLGASYYTYQHYQEAISWYEKALIIDPHHLPTYERLVYLYRLTGQEEKAVETINRSYNKVWQK